MREPTMSLPTDDELKTLPRHVRVWAARERVRRFIGLPATERPH